MGSSEFYAKAWSFKLELRYGNMPYSVGFYDSKSEWITESRCNTHAEAVERVRKLNETSDTAQHCSSPPSSDNSMASA